MKRGTAQVRPQAWTLLAALAMCLTLTMPAWAAGAASEAQTAPVRALMERSGLRQQITAWRPWMAQNAKELRNNEELPQRNREIAAQVLERMFDPAAVLERVERNLLAAWSAPDGKAVLAFLDGELGRRMTAFEVASGDIATQAAEREWKEGLAQAPPADERIALIVELDSAAWVSQTAVETWTIMSTASALAVAAAGPRDAEIGPEEVKRVRDAVRQQIAEPIRQEVLLSMLFTYRDASPEDLRAYIDFHTSPAGQWYRGVMSGAMLRALSDTAAEAGRQISHQVAI